MNSFEERLLNYLASEAEASEPAIHQHFTEDPGYDLELVREYLKIIELADNLKNYRQADLQDAWNKIVSRTGISSDFQSSPQVDKRTVTHTNGKSNGSKHASSEPKIVSDKIGFETSTREAKHRSIIESPLVEEPIETERKDTRWKTWLSVAASLLLVGGTVAYFLLRDPYLHELADTHASVTILPDKTKVTLEEGATLSYLRPGKFMAADTREVIIDGEAIFDVTHDPNRPFIVRSDLTQIEVLGTIFRYMADGVYSEAENIEGKVDYQVLDGSDNAVLNPGDKASYDGDNMTVIPFELPPPPPPPAIPTNNIMVADLIDILGDKYPIILEMMPYMPYNKEIIKCNLSDELGALFVELGKNQAVEIEYSFKSGGYLLNKMLGNDTDLAPDYTYFDYIEGKPFKKIEQ